MQIRKKRPKQLKHFFNKHFIAYLLFGIPSSYENAQVPHLLKVEAAYLAVEGSLPVVGAHVLHEFAPHLEFERAHGAGVPNPTLAVHLGGFKLGRPAPVLS
jgi:hypothetical protein